MMKRASPLPAPTAWPGGPSLPGSALRTAPAAPRPPRPALARGLPGGRGLREELGQEPSLRKQREERGVTGVRVLRYLCNVCRNTALSGGRRGPAGS